jgi:hypothetical protein
MSHRRPRSRGLHEGGRSWLPRSGEPAVAVRPYLGVQIHPPHGLARRTSRPPPRQCRAQFPETPRQAVVRALTQERRSLLRPHEINEAGYLLARAAVGRPIEDPVDLRRLVECNETVFAARLLLSLGRGNMISDQRTTGGLCSLFVKAARRWIDDNLDRYIGLYQSPITWYAAAAFVMKAGNCNEFADMVMHLHSPKLRYGEVLLANCNDKLDHDFVTLHTPWHLDLTMDAWANGPAMFSEDTYWQDPEMREHQRIYGSVTGEAGAAPWVDFWGCVDYLSHELRRGDMVKALNAAEREPDGHMYSEPTMIVNGLGKAAMHALNRLSGPVQRQMAVEVMQRAYHLSEDQALRQVSEVIKAAKTLHTMQDHQARPPVAKRRRVA